jgi:hypothetical protein
LDERAACGQDLAIGQDGGAHLDTKFGPVRFPVPSQCGRPEVDEFSRRSSGIAAPIADFHVSLCQEETHEDSGALGERALRGSGSFTAIGRRAEARKLLNDLQRQSQSTYIPPYVIATIYAGLGDKDKAFEFLDKAYRERSLNLSWHINADLRIDNLRSDPRFRVLLRRMGLT